MKKWIIDDVEYTDIDEITDYIIEGIDVEEYDNMLDDVYGKVEIAGYEWFTSSALRQLDPIAYDYEFYNYKDSQRDDITYKLQQMTDGEIDPWSFPNCEVAYIESEDE